MISGFSLKHTKPGSNTGEITAKAKALPKGVIARSQYGIPIIITDQHNVLVRIPDIAIWNWEDFGDNYTVMPEGTVFYITQT